MLSNMNVVKAMWLGLYLLIVADLLRVEDLGDLRRLCNLSLNLLT